MGKLLHAFSARADLSQEESFSVVLYSNMAATYLKLEQGDKAVKYAKLGVEAAGASVPAKLLLRLGKAYYMKGDLFK